MTKFTRAFGLMIAVLMVMSMVVGVTGAQDDIKVLNINWGTGDVPSLDPAVATDTSSISILNQTHPGLTRLNEVSLDLEEGVASWVVSEDGLTYTFSIKEGIPWVHYDADAGAVAEVTDADGNVRMLKASDFAYGMTRTLNPETAGDYAYVLAAWVENGEAVNAGDVGLEELGVEAVDDQTLVVTVPEAASFVPNVLGMWMAAAQPQWAIEEHGDFWTEAENFNSYGPYAVKEWLHGESLTLVKNPFWQATEGIPVPAIDEIFGTMLEQSAQLANFEAGLLDTSEFPSAEVDRILADPVLSEKYVVVPGGCTYYYGFNVEKEPFTDVRVRRAFSMAINRQAIIDNILKGGQAPAYFFSRPNLVAAPTAEQFADLVIGEDLEVAMAELQGYLDENGITLADLPPITLMHNESESHAAIAQAVQQMWNDSLGVEVDIATQEWAVYLDTLSEDAPQIYRLGWCLDYPDTHNFLMDVFHSTSAHNDTNWSNPEFDALVEEAKTLADTEARRELYAQADFILSNQDAAIAPIYFYTGQRLTQPWIERTFSQTGSERYEKWDIDLDAKANS